MLSLFIHSFKASTSPPWVWSSEAGLKLLCGELVLILRRIRILILFRRCEIVLVLVPVIVLVFALTSQEKLLHRQGVDLYFIYPHGWCAGARPAQIEKLRCWEPPHRRFCSSKCVAARQPKLMTLSLVLCSGPLRMPSCGTWAPAST